MTKRLTTRQTIGVTLAGLLGLCCCGSGIAGAFSDDSKPRSAPAATTSAATATTPVQAQKAGGVLTSVSPTADTPAPTTATTSAAPKPTRTPTVRKTTSPPRTTAPKPKPKPTPVKTTAPSVQKGVHPGAFCTPRGALGRTSTGKLMRCGPSATDSRNRWRAA
ncbi:hypothetical protein ACN265_18825 [Micromonospora sp. WMMD730]|uniref:hypothetical protein n=1 Tax=Micromonospora sp. WMMD730 TaxID=3404128 RepID=UPI003B95711C